MAWVARLRGAQFTADLALPGCYACMSTDGPEAASSNALLGSGSARSPSAEFGEPAVDDSWLEPLVTDGGGWATTDPATVYGHKDTIRLAYIAALQRLPPNQRAVLILREVLAFLAVEVADLLDTSVQSANSALQRARQTLGGQPCASPQQRATAAQAESAEAFATAFESGDVPALVALLSEQVRFTMPPLLAWFEGRDDVVAFLGTRVLATPWRAEPIEVNGQPALACYQQRDGVFVLSALNVLSISDSGIDWIASFLDPRTLGRLHRAERLQG